MTTVWFSTPQSTGRGRLRAAGVTGLSIDGPRRVRRQGSVPPRPVAAGPAPAARQRSHEFRLEARA